jgi:NADH:quinone reductase (non-electrogenic)
MSAGGGGRHRVVIVGGGFGGLPPTRFLGRRRVARRGVDVTLIDRRNHHLFQPLLYQVATGLIPPGQIAPALRHIVRQQKNVRVELAEVTGFDLNKRLVYTSVMGLQHVRSPTTA